MPIDSAHKSRWMIGEVIFGIPFLLSLVLQFFVPVIITQGLLRLALFPVGIVFIITGLRIIVLARREFARFEQPTDPGFPTNKVIQTGVFSISRNPLYLSAVLVFLGIAFMLNNLWAFITLMISIFLCLYVLILPEERYLAKKFGQEYQNYQASVHRWLGRK
jgi:protein-S-isoprenylcysteine O-methyltransferase Ste14